ncbi:hypothetical protein MMYC01_210650, partial [Madurella mycetomatis]
WRDTPHSCGRRVYFDPRRGRKFWEPVGPVTEAWSLLGPRISARAQALARFDPAFSIHLVMIGESIQTAAPHVVFCVDDSALQQVIRNDRLLNDILSAHPVPLGMHFCPNLPQLLAQAAPSADLTQDDGPLSSAARYSVWATEAGPRIGTRLYVACHDGGPLRMATGGPVFLHDGKTYQTTVQHVFCRSGSALAAPIKPSFQLDLDMDDSESDTDDIRHSNPSADDLSDGDAICCEDQEGPFPHLPSASLSTQGPEDAEANQDVEKGKDPEIPRGLVRLGNALPETVVGVQRAVDYALIEVRASSNLDPNMVSYDPSDSSKRVRVTRPADMAKTLPGTPVIVATSSGPVSGKIFTTLAYIKPRYQRQSLAVYPVMLNEDMALEPGDCGSLVIQRRDEEVHMLGHVVFGHPGTAMAYILPMDGIIDNMAKVLKVLRCQRILLYPGPCEQQKPENNMRTEFASPKFYKGLGEMAMPEKHILHDLAGKIIAKFRSTCATRKISTRVEAAGTTKYTFEDLFFRLPPEIRDLVISCLDFRDAMSLRQVSLRFRAAVSVNGSAISKRFLVSNPLPPLAQRLYPHKSPNLAHIHMVGHYHAIAWRLADHMVQWLRREMFLYGSRFQKQQFQPMKVRMKKRLLPPLLLLGRFFEICHDFLEEQAQKETEGQGQEGSIAFPFERDLMKDCSTELLVQTQDVALVFITFLRRTMRPPSKYGSFERTLRHDLKALDKKVAAVREYCAPSPPSAREVPDLGGPGGSSGDSDRSTATATQPGNPFDLGVLLPRLPDLDQIWRPSAEALLMERRVIGNRHDLNSYEAVLKQLIHQAETPADLLYKEGHDLWHALSDGENLGKPSASV